MQRSSHRITRDSIKPHCTPGAALEVPAEFTSVTETELMALVSPENVNGICKSKAPPAFRPLWLLNQLLAGVLIWDPLYEKLVPFSVAPCAGENVRLTPDRSRVTETATISTVKPVAVTSMICTEVIDGALAGIVIVVFGLGLGKTSGCGCPLRVSVNPVIVTVIVPATLPT
jgi:hypothetical protein